MSTSNQSSESDYHAIKQRFENGEIEKASKDELQRIAILLSRTSAYGSFGSASYPQMCETVRTLLIVRMSEEANKEATRISTIALWIAGAALFVALVQAASSLCPEGLRVFQPFQRLHQ